MRAIVGYTDEEAQRDREDWRERLEPRPVDRPYLQVGDRRPRDRLGRLEPRNLFRDGVLPLRLWGYHGLFARVVPQEHLLVTVDRERRDCCVVLCACGVQTLLGLGFTGCRGSCGRWFLGVGREVRVCRF
jgi:hypothetical protein